jgi:hypothetical protein
VTTKDTKVLEGTQKKHGQEVALIICATVSFQEEVILHHAQSTNLSEVTTVDLMLLVGRNQILES